MTSVVGMKGAGAILLAIVLSGCKDVTEVPPGGGDDRAISVPFEFSARLPIAGGSLPLSPTDCAGLLAVEPVWQVSDTTGRSDPNIFSISDNEVSVSGANCIFTQERDVVFLYPGGSSNPNLSDLRSLTTAFFPGDGPASHVSILCSLVLPPPDGQNWGPFVYVTLGEEGCSTGALASDPRSYP